MTEQLALDQLFGDGRAIDFDELSRPSLALCVNAARDEFFARAVLAVDQHAAVGWGRHGHLLAQLVHQRALAHHRVMAIHTRTEGAVFRFELPLPQRVRDDQDGLVEREGLLNEIERAHLDRAHGRLDVAVP